MDTLDVCNTCLVAIHYGDTYPHGVETLAAIMARVEELGAPYFDLPGDDDSPSFYRCAICDQKTDTYEVSLSD